MKKSFAAILAISCSISLSSCTVDAQLASQLLSSLQSSVKQNTTEDGKVTLTASDLASAADEAGVEVVCGGNPMKIASVDDEDDEDSSDDDADDNSDDSSDDDADNENAQDTQAPSKRHLRGPLQSADQIHPVMIGRGNAPGQFQRIQIDIHLANELQGLQQWQGAERDQHFQDIQRRYPMMQQARPIRFQGGANGGQQRQIMFAQFGEDNQSRPSSAYPANNAGYGYAYAQGTRVSTSAKTTQARLGRYPLPAQFLNDVPGAKGQPCSLLSQESSNESTSDDSEE